MIAHSNHYQDFNSSGFNTTFIIISVISHWLVTEYFFPVSNQYTPTLLHLVTATKTNQLESEVGNKHLHKESHLLGFYQSIEQMKSSSITQSTHIHMYQTTQLDSGATVTVLDKSLMGIIIVT